jgi:glycosyltransferase involved in cell wall biosynthesis
VVSRLSPAKGIEDFIDAAARLAVRFPAASFLIVGDGAPNDAGKEYRATLEQRAHAAGLGARLVFSGQRLDVPQLLAQMTVAVLPSLSEALSNALLESMAAGAPVVATDVGGNPEVVEDGVTGLLVPASAPELLAQAIGRLLESPAEAARLGAAGRAHVHDRFSVDRMVAATEQLYLGLLQKGSRSERYSQGAPREPATSASP